MRGPERERGLPPGSADRRGLAGGRWTLPGIVAALCLAALAAAGGAESTRVSPASAPSPGAKVAGDIVEMVLAGAVNKDIVNLLNTAGGSAVGLSGKDGNLLHARRIELTDGADVGHVGRIVSVHTEALEILLHHDLTPVVSPISLGLDGKTYNVNADHAATAIATATGASALAFLSNVPGVLVGNQIVPLLTPARAEALIANQEINGGMVPKVRSALDAIAGGVREVRITDMAGLLSQGGTRVVASARG